MKTQARKFIIGDNTPMDNGFTSISIPKLKKFISPTVNNDFKILSPFKTPNKIVSTGGGGSIGGGGEIGLTQEDNKTPVGVQTFAPVMKKPSIQTPSAKFDEGYEVETFSGIKTTAPKVELTKPIQTFSLGKDLTNIDNNKNMNIPLVKPVKSIVPPQVKNQNVKIPIIDKVSKTVVEVPLSEVKKSVNMNIVYGIGAIVVIFLIFKVWK